MLKKQNIYMCVLLVLFLFLSITNNDVFSDSPNMIVNGDEKILSTETSDLRTYKIIAESGCYHGVFVGWFLSI